MDYETDNFKGVRVLILEGYAKQSLPLIKAFRKLGCEVSALCNSRLDVAFTSRFTNHKILGTCSRDDIEKTTKYIRNLLKTGNYDVVIPTVDFSAGILSKNKEEFSKYCLVLANDWTTYDIAVDKSKTMKVCLDNDIPCPKTFLNISCVEEIMNMDLSFPMVIKPKTSYGAIGFRRVDSKEDLEQLLMKIDDKIEQYVIQEYIPQTDIQYECAMFVDNNNKVKTAVVFSKNRWFPIDGGSSTLNITVERPDIIANCSKLLQLINWRGPADIDLIQDPRDGIAKIMEINPRVSGSVKIAFLAGTNQAKQMLELLYGHNVTKYESYKLDQRLRCSQTDFLWFIKSKRRFKSKPSYFNRKHTKDQIFSWDDPLPWFSFTLQKIFNYRAEMRKRNHK